MQLIEYFICVATRHGQAKSEHEEEIRKQLQKKKKRKNCGQSLSLTFKDEEELLEGIIDSIDNKPACLENLTNPALVTFAYILKSKLANETYIEGHEIIDQLVCDPERTIDYLNGFAELIKDGWIRAIERPGISFTDQPPFCWLQSCIELSNTFHQEMGAADTSTLIFNSNETYLDALFGYLQALARCDSNLYRVNDPEADLAVVQPEGWYRKIAQRVEGSTCELPGVAAQKKYSLTVLQYLTLAGLVGEREGDLRYEFSSPSSAAHLFAHGRICRTKMKEHLFGEKSPLLRHRLIEGANGTFGETVKLTQLGSRALYGKLKGKSSYHELQKRIKKTTLFDIEQPKIDKGSLQLPEQVMEAISSLLFSESKRGKQLRKSWHTALPAAWGSPTGSTLLLYGPPGTGKTLTAQYLASEMKLPLLKIDAARVLSCWVGESEQNVRRIFDDYTNLQQELGKAPVLLLNEADQLLGTRDAGTNAVDRMNNNMQNLFLEGLERFSGILVATTNRRDLLDEAFSRRFTYKLELPPPDKDLRIALWKSHLPMERLASDIEISVLADLGLTGGEIRLVIERTVRLLAYRGVTTIDRKTLTDIAKEELTCRMKHYGNTGKIGFDTS